jgi:hypothetical protein
MVCLTVELAEFAAEVRVHVTDDLLHPLQRAEAEHLMPVSVGENQHENGSAASVSIPVSAGIAGYREGCAASVQLSP